MPHADITAHVKRRHDGIIPDTWLGGPPEFQKAKVIAAVAWHDIKDAADPELVACDLTHQQNCIGVVESIMRGNQPDQTEFAQRAYQRWLEVKDLNLEAAKEIANAQ